MSARFRMGGTPYRLTIFATPTALVQLPEVPATRPAWRSPSGGVSCGVCHLAFESSAVSLGDQWWLTAEIPPAARSDHRTDEEAVHWFTGAWCSPCAVATCWCQMSREVVQFVEFRSRVLVADRLRSVQPGLYRSSRDLPGTDHCCSRHQR